MPALDVDMARVRLHLMVLSLTAATSFSASADAWGNEVLLPGDGTRGKALYQQKCVGCHVSLVGGDGSALHSRPNRRVQTPEGLLSQVNACNQQLKAGLAPAQIKDIVAYLYGAFYKR